MRRLRLKVFAIMKVSKNSAIKLSVIAFVICFFFLLSFADSKTTADSNVRSAPAVVPSHGSDAGKTSENSTQASPQQPTKQLPLFNMSQEEADRRSVGCVDCHKGIEDMHNGAITIGCIDCHGGNAEARLPQGAAQGSAPYEETKKKSHIEPRYPEFWKNGANPERPYALTLKESAEFIRFVNPGDLRVASLSCGTAGCHVGDVHNVQKSMMTTGAMLWGAALYNNGSFPLKNYRFGESYNQEGIPQRLMTYPQPTEQEMKEKGVLPFLDPLPRWEVTQMGNILRTFERGGRKAAEIGNPLTEEPPGKPTQNLLSQRGLGTLLRTDPVFLGLQKTRLLDPMLSMYGTNDHPGDYRSSGCTACHVVYANDSNPFHAGPYAKYGHTGQSQSADPTIPKNQSGHPVKHQFTRAIPSSNCVVCHMHPGTLVLNSYFGYTWWDLETDGDKMYDPKKRTPEEEAKILNRNPEESSLRGKWSDPEFLKTLGKDVNPTLKHTQFADFAGHGWIFRSAFKKDRKGNLLDVDGNIIENVTNEALQRAIKEDTETPEARKGVPVHLKDIHLEKGMHCVDCHFKQDNHGNGKLYGEVRNAIEIDCKDCHGTITERADPTSKDAKTTAAAGGNRMLDYRNLPSRKDRFFKRDGKLFQRAAVAVDESGKPKEWELKQVADTINPASPNYNEKAALAKTILNDGKSWGSGTADDKKLAHSNNRMTCYSCHTAWTPSCFGCHLKMEANEKRPMLHNEGESSLRNWTSYNFQTLRDDVFLLGKDGTVTGRRFAPVRSACAVYVSSQNALREWIYSQQQTVSAEGYSGQSFSSHFPHTVRTKETRSCDDCHLSENNDNNAFLAMTYMQGTNFYNFIGRYCYVGLGEAGFAGVVVTERNEPQAVIGSYLHKIAYPEEYKKHQEHEKELHEFYEHPGNDVSTNFKPFVKGGSNVVGTQLRGEYLYAACGKAGFKFFDVANIDQKGFSERITTAPFSPLGQKFYVKSKNATAIASPSTLAVDPTRSHRPENEEAENRDDKQKIPLVYAFLYGTDSEEGLVVMGNTKAGSKNNIGVATLLDGDPNNNFIDRALAWNPNNILKGASNITIAGTYAYISCDRGLVIVDISDPLNPKLSVEIGEPFIKRPRDVQIQFRYAFVCDAEGLKVIDITNPAAAKPVSRAVVPLSDANKVYLVRTYAYVAAGKQGLAIIDIEKPEQPRLEQLFTAEGKIKDAKDVKVGMTNVSLFAYIAGGKEGLQIVQLTSPEDTKGHYGFSPRPTPKLIASHHFHVGEALSISEGVDRDRAIDENGNQLAVFGRRGARPLNGEELQRMYSINGQLFRVPDIKDNNPKMNKDIRRFYGAPTQENADKMQKKKSANTGVSSEGEEKKDASAPKQDAQDAQSSLKQTKKNRLADIFVFASLFGAVVIRFSRLRK
jgi:hypothetical protein